MKIGKLYKTNFSELSVNLRKTNPNHGSPLRNDPYYTTQQRINPSDIFMILEFESLKRNILSSYPGPKNDLEEPFVIKVLVNEKIGYIILRDREIREVC